MNVRRLVSLAMEKARASALSACLLPSILAATLFQAPAHAHPLDEISIALSRQDTGFKARVVLPHEIVVDNFSDGRTYVGDDARFTPAGIAAIDALIKKHLVVRGGDGGADCVWPGEVSFQQVPFDARSPISALEAPLPCGTDSKLLSVALSLQDELKKQSYKTTLYFLDAGNRQVRALPEAAGRHTFGLQDGTGTILTFLVLGIEHILLGIDHLLFLCALLVTSVLVRKEDSWRGVDTAKQAFRNVVKIVTCFTLAHSVTLSLAALDIFTLPSKPVEAVIAGSIGVMAINNMRAFLRDSALFVVVAFGLIHGMGFAGALQEIGLAGSQKVSSLIAFNVGVELGQLGVVALVMAPLYVFRNRPSYARIFVPAFSTLILALAVFWLSERLFLS